MPGKPGSFTIEDLDHDGTLGLSADDSAKAAMHDSLPANDPVATTSAVGVCAEAVANTIAISAPRDVLNPATVAARFADHVTAKLATKKLVRDVPADRRCAVLSDEGDG